LLLRTPRPALACLLTAALLTACTADADDVVVDEAAVDETADAETADAGPRIIQPGAPGEPSRVLTEDELAELDLGAPEHTDADVAFMQMMIPHHAQALEMTRLVPDRTDREDLPLFVERMDISQEDEIALIVRWLEARDEEVPDLGEAHHDGDHSEHSDPGMTMPGMLTDEQMAELEAASGEEFDRLFLLRMREHHLGALQMVEELFATDGAGAEPEIFQFASHVDSDQRIEISRIESMLADIEGGR
jgi:uncharacterized protein (DUF305 family)